jgi:hypothetical protein
MDFFKKNYEKILLGLVLAGLIGVLVFMIFYIAADKQSMEERASGLLYPRVTALKDLDLTAESNVIARVQSPYHLDFETGNKLFNPMDWQRTLDGSLVKASKLGPEVAVVTGIKPLYLILTLESVVTNEFGARYVIGVQREAAAVPAQRHRQQRYVSLGDKPNDVFGLVAVKGPADNPDALVLKLMDSGETISLSSKQPYRRVDAYTVDFRYDPEKKVFRNRRDGDRVSFGGSDYLIDEINKNELILSDLSNQKKTSLQFNP